MLCLDPVLKVPTSVQMGHPFVPPLATDQHPPVPVSAPPSRCRVTEGGAVHANIRSQYWVDGVRFYPFPEMWVGCIFEYRIALDLGVFLICNSGVEDYGSFTRDDSGQPGPAPVLIKGLRRIKGMFKYFPMDEVH